MPVNTTKKVWATGYNNSAFRPLYNGNIASMQVNIPKLGSAFLYQYTYDQLNRIVGMQADTTLNTSTNTWSPFELKDYKERVSYDANGNILNYMRRGKVTAGTNPSGLMDSLNYKYYYTNTSGNRKWYDPGQGIPSDALSLTNKLAHVDDNTGYDSYFTEDIDDQDTANYAYDEIGNLIKDTKEGITGIEWTVYGKIKKITKTGGTTIEYRYDASGNRIWKKAASIETWYVRDASGNVMSIYTYNNNSINSGALSQTETDLYGSSRLGMLKPNINVQSSLAGPAIGTKYITTFTRGNKIFELSNHLGNVLVTVSDKKIPVAKTTPNQAQVSYYTADVLSATDYYPFGMSMPRRDTTFSGSYRYKFNGKEVDKDIQGADYDYGFRIYDPRIGKFLSIDPMTISFASWTPYSFAMNRVIDGVDLDGLEWTKADLLKLKETATTILNQTVDGLSTAARGSANAITNALSLGLTDNLPGTFGTDKAHCYKNDAKKITYLVGRVVGDVSAFVMGTAEINTGAGVALATGIETVGIGAATGAAAVAHGYLVQGTATADLTQTLAQLSLLGVKIIEEKPNTTSSGTDQQVKNANGSNPSSSKSNTASNQRYDGPKPEYQINEKHVKLRNGQDATPLPGDAEEVYKNAIPDDPQKPKHWYGLNKDGKIYRYSSSNDGKAHFSGRNDTEPGIKPSAYAKERLKKLTTQE